jgi:pyruvate dehydrogenase E2 component (dihydrolipoamide acetyltransferase)
MRNLTIWTLAALLALAAGCKKEEAPEAAAPEAAPAAEAAAAPADKPTEKPAEKPAEPTAAEPMAANPAGSTILGVWHVDFASLKESQPEFQKMSPQELQIMEQMLGSMTFQFQADTFSMNAMGKKEELSYSVKSRADNKWVLAVTDKAGKVEDANITLTGDRMVLSKEGEQSALTLKRGAPPKPSGNAAAAATIQALGAAAAAGQAPAAPAVAPAAATTTP